MSKPSRRAQPRAEYVSWRYRLRQGIGPGLALVAFVVAAGLLFRELRHYDFKDIVASLRAIPLGHALWALGLTVLSYVVLIGYDYLAIRFLRHELSMPRIALVSFIGHVSSFNFGAILGGASVRYRLYSAWGLSAVEIVKLITLSTVTFWSGYLLLAGIIFIVDPVALPPDLHMPLETVKPLGIVLLGLVVGYLALCVVRRSPARFRDWELPIPSLQLAVGQITVAAVDLALSGGALYVLLPADLAISYGHFLTIYLIAVVAVLFTHVPGGLGILEVVILLLLAPKNPAAVVGSMLVFRALYYLLPLVVASILLAGHEMTLRRRAIGRMAGAVGRWTPAVAPRLLSFLMLAAGAILLFSGALPARVGWLTPHLPLVVVEVSHFMNSIAGVVVLLVAYSLQRRLSSAFWVSAVALVCGIVFSILKGFDVVEAASLSVVLAVLLPCRPFFYRRASLLDERYTPEWMATVVAVLLAAGWVALFAFKNVEYSNELWSRFSIEGDAERVLRSALGVFTVLILIALVHRFHHPAPEPHVPVAAELEKVREIVAASPRSEANLALSGDKNLLFNEARTGFAMYAVERRSWVSLGDPIAQSHEQPELIWSFRELAEHYGGWPVFYQVSSEQLPLYLDLGLTLVKLGEEARVPLADFSLDDPRRAELAASVARARDAGCRFEIVPADCVAPLWPALEEVADAWLSAQRSREHRFAWGTSEDVYLRQFPLAVVRRGGTILAFANLWTAGQREEVAVDLLRYRPEAIAAANDFMLIELMLWAKAQGFAWFNLGLAPIADSSEPELANERTRLAALVDHYGEYFYPPSGLREYKQKFEPVWSTRYLAAPGGLNLPRIMADVAKLISGTRPQLPKQPPK